MDVSPSFEKIATHYVLLSWVYDAFQELPYLRVRGDFGSGKTRALLTIGSLCYKPMFASGASTVSPLFRILDAFRGTLVMDESDFRFSDEASWSPAVGPRSAKDVECSCMRRNDDCRWPG